MLILDLDSTDREQYTRTSSYLQHPYVFNMIHTFGGQLAMFGRTDRINQRPFEARRMENSSLIGLCTGELTKRVQMMSNQLFVSRGIDSVHSATNS